MLPLLLGLLAAQTTSDQLARPILDPKQPQLEAQVYMASRVPPVQLPRSAADWDTQRDTLRRRILEEVVFRGEARSWRTSNRKVEFTGEIPGDGYRIRKLRFEILPGMWAPAVLYEPANPSGKLPVVLNVNGHEKDGIATPYIQQRCVQLARMGYLAFNGEWMGRGVLDLPGFNHYSMPQLDLTGSSGLAVFFLEMERSLDILLQHPNADPQRVAVTGLSGGGWQTTFLTALDPRIKLAVPVAGHSSFITRTQMPMMDMGDSEQTPSDLATVADYLHLTAMTAPRPLLLINNAKDNCCFRADYAMAPLVQTANAIFKTYNAADRFSYYINHSDGHNYDGFSRRELYKFLSRQFQTAPPPVETPIAPRSAQELTSALPADNLTFQSLAQRLAAGLPKPGKATKENLARIVRYQKLALDVDAVNAPYYAIRTTSGAWTIPAVSLGPADAKQAVILIADEGRRSQAARAEQLIGEGKRVFAVDPFLIGENKIKERDFLFALLLASLGERPLGLQASQLAAVARWLTTQGHSVTIEAHGRRTSLAAQVAAALEPQIQSAKLNGNLTSLKQAMHENIQVPDFPELFCFGLLESFDIDQIR
ncbi:MAG: prolyl oligopeptidase family serine peptidase [Bryobacterales bacterium]|nr:prolyl oligopeptidase family serine peptidase [Bryobacterales bacterium]